MSNNSLPVEVPSGPAKPRAVSRTHVIDTGQGVRWIEDQLELSGSFIDSAKLGWGTSMVTSGLEQKLDAYRSHDIEICMGGTLFELAYLQGKVSEYADWLRFHGVQSVEVSDGSINMEGAEKLKAIAQLSKEFKVYSEVGSKDADAIVSPARWVAAIRAELAAGAVQVILEGRETGTAGLYRKSGEIRTGLIDEIFDSGITSDQIIFEAPVKEHQVFLIKLVGSDVNLANIAIGDALSLETLRRGLRGDTLLQFHDPDA